MTTLQYTLVPEYIVASANAAACKLDVLKD